ncbi:aminoglycoside adenylyltransferase domain-containing protein [Clostridium sp. Marseille-QA1073]
MKMNINILLTEIIEKYKNLLGENLVGIYLHGSLVMGCFNSESSDIDFLIVVKDKLSFNVKRRIVDILLDLSNFAPKKGFEVSVILEKYSKDFVYPTPFELHYSNEYKDKYIKDKGFLCENGEDADLAAHITIINKRGRCLYGKEIKEVFGEVPEKYYINSILNDVENAIDEIVENPVYIILNLCRVLYYLKERVVSSKYEGGIWGKTNYKVHEDLMKMALNIYSGHINEEKWNEEELKNFAAYMIEEINKTYKGRFMNFNYN